MAEQDEALVSRRYLSQISIRIPVFGTFVLFNNLSSARQIKAIRRRLTKSPDDLHLRLSLAALLVTEGQNEEALAEWLKAIMKLPFDEDVQDDPELSQENAYAHYIFGLILHNKGAVEEAINEWKKASALDEYGIGDLARGKLKETDSGQWEPKL